MPGFLGFIEDTLFPKRCVSCGKLGSYVCHVCRRAVVPFSPQRCPACDRPAVDGLTHPKCRTSYGMDGLVGMLRYAGPVRRAIKEIKYRFSYDIAGELVALAKPDATFLTAASWLVPVPLHAQRLRRRGFNQALVLANLIAGTTGCRVVDDVLVRVLATGAQAEIGDRKKRMANVRGAFGLRGTPHNIRGANIILVDDVATTGATMCAAAQTLKRAGAAAVYGLAIAR